MHAALVVLESGSMATAKHHRRRLITAMLVCFAMVGCKSHPFVTDQDARDVVEKVTEKSIAKFGKNTCVVEQFGDDYQMPIQTTPPEGELMNDDRIRFWILPRPEIAFPKFVTQKYRATPRNSGCAPLIQLGLPIFFDVEDNGQRKLVAVEDVAILCRPKCGQTLGATLEKHGDAFTLSEDDIHSFGGIP